MCWKGSIAILKNLVCNLKRMLYIQGDKRLTLCLGCSRLSLCGPLWCSPLSLGGPLWWFRLSLGGPMWWFCWCLWSGDFWCPCSFAMWMWSPCSFLKPSLLQILHIILPSYLANKKIESKTALSLKSFAIDPETSRLVWPQKNSINLWTRWTVLLQAVSKPFTLL